MAEHLQKKTEVIVTTIRDEHGSYCLAVHRDEEEAKRYFIEEYVLSEQEFSDAYCDPMLDGFRAAMDAKDWQACIDIYLGNKRKWSIPIMHMQRMEIND